jgi:integrase
MVSEPLPTKSLDGLAGIRGNSVRPRKDPDATRPVPKVNNAHDRAIRDSGIAPARLYDLRHTWATRAAESGIDLVTLAAMLGHSKINMVLRYVHVQQAHQTQAMQRMEQYGLKQASAKT